MVISGVVLSASARAVLARSLQRAGQMQLANDVGLALGADWKDMQLAPNGSGSARSVLSSTTAPTFWNYSETRFGPKPTDAAKDWLSPRGRRPPEARPGAGFSCQPRATSAPACARPRATSAHLSPRGPPGCFLQGALLGRCLGDLSPDLAAGVLCGVNVHVLLSGQEIFHLVGGEHGCAAHR